MLTRRRLLQLAPGAVAGAAPAALAAETATLGFENGERPLVRYPEKRPLLRLTTRPPQLETPFAVFDQGPLTPNDAFFVRYHLAGSPPVIQPQDWKLQVRGAVAAPITLGLDELKRLPRIEYTAVLQCSGNGRGFAEPRVAGGQAGNGLMGAARWAGVPLKAVLERAGVRPGALQVAFNGADRAPAPGIADYVKTLALDHAMDGEVMLAVAMNGEDLPVLNGYPVRLVVPGWYGTYWIKHLTDIEVLDRPTELYWMDRAYRIPATDCACVAPGTAPASTVPINRLNVRSFLTSHADGARVAANRRTSFRGVAFDHGSGIRAVEVSTVPGAWVSAELGPENGRYGFRPWRAVLTLPPGRHLVKVRAVARDGAGQPDEPRWNPSGYMRNVIEAVNVTAA